MQGGLIRVVGCVLSCAVAGSWRPATDDGILGVSVGESGLASRGWPVEAAGSAAGWRWVGQLGLPCVKSSSIAAGGMNSAALLLGKQLTAGAAALLAQQRWPRLPPAASYWSSVTDKPGEQQHGSSDTVNADRQADSAWRCQPAAAAAALDDGALDTFSSGAGQQQQRDLKQMGVADAAAGCTGMGVQSYQHVASLKPPGPPAQGLNNTPFHVGLRGRFLWRRYTGGCVQLCLDSGGSWAGKRVGCSLSQACL